MSLDNGCCMVSGGGRCHPLSGAAGQRDKHCKCRSAFECPVIEAATVVAT